MADHDSNNNSSSPVPVIGLYIAGASIACMFMMLWDIVAGIVARKRWLPCKVFTLDSVTLALLGVVAKIPVDLTSSMPSRYDQLSKLTGTVMICICMGVLMPSLGASNESACFTNMVALTIFVITVTVNICIQLRTGVIDLFFKEHIIILCLMLLLLLFLWESSINSRSSKIHNAVTYKDLVKTGNKSMFGRLRLCYLYSYCSDPYFAMCTNTTNVSITIVCVVCSVILMVATIRSVISEKLDFGSGGHSDYDWSIPFIVVIQNLTVIVGTLAILFRWLALFRYQVFQDSFQYLWFWSEEPRGNRILRKWPRWQTSIRTLYKRSISTAQFLFVTPVLLWDKYFELDGSYLENFEEFPRECSIYANKYNARKSVDDMIKFREVCCRRVSLTNMLKLLPRTSAQQLYPRDNNDYQAYFQKSFLSKNPREKVENKVCSLSAALLMKIAQICIPKDHLESFLLNAYLEAKEIILFIDKTLLARDERDTSKLSFAKAVWEHGDFSFSCLIPDNILGGQRDLDRAVDIMERLKEKFHEDDICYEIEYMVDFINQQNSSSIEELSNFIKEMLVYMLRLLITQLPVAIYKSLSECPWEEFEERVKFVMSFLFKMESAGALENDIGWSFPPPDSGISSFIFDNTPGPHRLCGGPMDRLMEIYPYNKTPLPPRRGIMERLREMAISKLCPS